MFDHICCSYLISINYYFFSKPLSDGKILAWNFLSEWSLEGGFSKVIISNVFYMGPDEDFLNTSWYFTLNSLIFINYFSYLSNWFNYYSSCSNLWLYGEILSWNFLSKWTVEAGCSEVRVSNSFWMSPDENFLNSSWCSSLNYINSSSYSSKPWQYG